jgi:hypothetical protein
MKCQISKYEKEIEHLKQIYKNLFDSIKRSRVQTQNSNLKQQETEDLKSQLYGFVDKKFENVLQNIESMKKKNVDFQITKVSFPKPLFDSYTSDFEKETGEKMYLFCRTVEGGLIRFLRLFRYLKTLSQRDHQVVVY